MADVGPNYMACHPTATAILQGAATWRIQCHDPRAKCHIAECCHQANSTACHPSSTLEEWRVHLADGSTIWIKFRRLVQNDMSTAVMSSKSKPDIPIRLTFGRIPWHVIPEPPATLQGAATWWIHCHVSRATCATLQGAVTWWNQCHHIAGCNNSIRHVENRFSPYYIFLFYNAVWDLTSGGFRIISDTLVIYIIQLQRCILVKLECVQCVVKNLS